VLCVSVLKLWYPAAPFKDSRGSMLTSRRITLLRRSESQTSDFIFSVKRRFFFFLPVSYEIQAIKLCDYLSMKVVYAFGD